MSDRWHYVEIKKNNGSDEPKPLFALPHNQVRHNENAKKPLKHSLEDSVVLNILKERCDCKTSCFLNFCVNDVVSIRNNFDYFNGVEKTENEISVALLYYLGSHTVADNTDGCHKIGKKSYCLSFSCRPGVYVCPAAFCRLVGVCVKRLREVAEHESEYGINLMEPIPEDNEQYAPKENLICSFLEHVTSSMTHKVKSDHRDGSSFEYDSIIGFHEPKDLFDFYVTMIEENVIPPFLYLVSCCVEETISKSLHFERSPVHRL
jgi:hypothetical protein